MFFYEPTSCLVGYFLFVRFGSHNYALCARALKFCSGHQMKRLYYAQRTKEICDINAPILFDDWAWRVYLLAILNTYTPSFSADGYI